MGDITKTEKLQSQSDVLFWSYGTSESIATLTVDLEITINDEHYDVCVSNIVIMKNHLKKKAEKVNSYLKELCMKKNNSLIDHPKSIRQRRLNKSQLHLNSKWSTVLDPTFVNHLLNIFDWRFEKYYMDKMGCHKQHMYNSPYADIWILFSKIT